MLHLGICDDDTKVLQYYKSMMLLFLKDTPIKINSYTSAESFLFHNGDNNINELDIIIIDIELKESNGIDVMKKMRAKGFIGELIYITSIKDYVFDSFETKPLNYILKCDENDIKFKETVIKAIENATYRKDDVIVVLDKGESKKIYKSDIMYIESRGRKVAIYCSDFKEIECYSKLEDILSDINSSKFIRIQRSFAVNLNYVKNIRGEKLKLYNQVELNIGRAYVKEVRDRFSAVITDNLLFMG